MDAVLHALSDKSRRIVLSTLKDGPATAGELCGAAADCPPRGLPAPAGAPRGGTGRGASSGRSFGCTACGPTRSPRSTSGWASTETCGSNAWTPCTPRSPGEKNNGEAEHEQRHAIRVRRRGNTAGGRRQGRRTYGGRLRHRHRGPLDGTDRSASPEPLDRRRGGRPPTRGCVPGALHQRLGRVRAAWTCASARQDWWSP